MNIYFNEFGLEFDDPILTEIISTIKSYVGNLEIGKAYKLKQIVDLAEPGWWETLRHHDVRSAGVSFRNYVKNGNIPGLILRDKKEKPRKYIRVK